ncbi:hypothetical protein AN403_6020 [Pseudomonas fluorescens]|uniref:Uncharacterized protein n=1 Tax=Pseudomonas fluorescens TaxID=294 RepID=A0A0N8NY38_PSEFL|nr:hypothetical protein AN403_6020 [Pseudomonas fluorescens]
MAQVYLIPEQPCRAAASPLLPVTPSPSRAWTAYTQFVIFSPGIYLSV